jgi:hypothetical protein
LRLPTWRESNLGSSLRFDTQGSQVRAFGIQAKLLLSLVSALVSPASAREKDGFLRNGLLDDLLLVQVNQKSLG